MEGERMSRIVIEKELCKGCEYCVTYCPKQLIHIGTAFNSMGFKYAVPEDKEGQCTACRICALMCPDAAIEVYQTEK